MVSNSLDDLNDRNPDNDPQDDLEELEEEEDLDLDGMVDPDEDDLDSLDDDEIDDLEDGDLLDEESLSADDAGESHADEGIHLTGGNNDGDSMDEDEDESVVRSHTFRIHRTFPRKRSGPDRDRPLNSTPSTRRNDDHARRAATSNPPRGKENKSSMQPRHGKNAPPKTGGQSKRL